MLKSGIKVTGKVNIKVRENDVVVEERNIDNLVVTTGKNYIASRIYNNSVTAMSHMGIGSSQTPQTLDDTGLLQEIVRTAFYSTTVTNETIEYVAEFTPGATSRSISEAGIFNASSSGVLLCRTTFPPITQSTSQTIAISWILSVG